MHQREDPAGANGGAFGMHSLGGECVEGITIAGGIQAERAVLVVERGVVRRARADELARALRLGLIGGRA